LPPKREPRKKKMRGRSTTRAMMMRSTWDAIVNVELVAGGDGRGEKEKALGQEKKRDDRSQEGDEGMGERKMER
jgi:hypothetical protein